MTGVGYLGCSRGRGGGMCHPDCLPVVSGAGRRTTGGRRDGLASGGDVSLADSVPRSDSDNESEVGTSDRA